MTEPVWMTPDPWEAETVDPRIERRRAAGRRYMAKKRRELNAARWRGAIGSLHSLACNDPTRHKGNRVCSPIPVYDR